MKKNTFINIGTLVLQEKTPSSALRGKALNILHHAEDQYIKTEDGLITEIGSMSSFSLQKGEMARNMHGAFIFPTWCDSHSHSVFAMHREQEFVMRLEGKSYQEIAAQGGGILNSAKTLSLMSEDQLYSDALQRIEHMIYNGLGALEIKSGYGLDEENELKILRVIKRLKDCLPIPIRSTYLAAHALPAEYKSNRSEYIQLIINDIMPKVAESQLADYCDVFCETGYFTPEEMEEIIVAGAQYNLKAKVHVNQFTSIGGIQTAVKHGAISVDHLEVMTPEDISCLGESKTIATLLPIAPFFLNDPFPEGGKLLEHNAAVALATDYNPGSAPSPSMQLAINLACTRCGLLPNEAFNAATINGAFAMEIQDQVGSIEVGKRANFCISSTIKSINEIPYALCSNIISEVILNGESYSGIN